jgi:hypothetical protein
MSNGYTPCSASTVSSLSPLTINYFTINISIPPHTPNPIPKPYFTNSLLGGVKPHYIFGEDRQGDPPT